MRLDILREIGGGDIIDLIQRERALQGNPKIEQERTTYLDTALSWSGSRQQRSFWNALHHTPHNSSALEIFIGAHKEVFEKYIVKPESVGTKNTTLIVKEGGLWRK